MEDTANGNHYSQNLSISKEVPLIPPLGQFPHICADLVRGCHHSNFLSPCSYQYRVCHCLQRHSLARRRWTLHLLPTRCWVSSLPTLHRWYQVLFRLFRGLDKCTECTISLGTVAHSWNLWHSQQHFHLYLPDGDSILQFLATYDSSRCVNNELQQSYARRRAIFLCSLLRSICSERVSRTHTRNTAACFWRVNLISREIPRDER